MFQIFSGGRPDGLDTTDQSAGSCCRNMDICVRSIFVSFTASTGAEREAACTTCFRPELNCTTVPGNCFRTLKEHQLCQSSYWSWTRTVRSQRPGKASWKQWRRMCNLIGCHIQFGRSLVVSCRRCRVKGGNGVPAEDGSVVVSPRCASF